MTRSWLALLVGLSGCGSPPQTMLDEDAALPPLAGMIAPIDSRRPLVELLEALERELLAAQQADSENEREDRVLRAEAITDLLLEADAPFVYLADGYYLSARLRQLQARADRVVAQIRRSRMPGRFATTPFPDAEVDILRQEVVGIRAAITRGGGPPPVPLDTLLQRHRDAQAARATAAARAAPSPAAQAPAVQTQPTTEP